MTEPLTTEEHAAVTAYALAHGENWKDDLLADWMDGRTQGTLQHLRNSRTFLARGLFAGRLAQEPVFQ